MSRPITIAALRKRLKRAEGAADFCEPTRLLLLEGRVKEARSVAQMAIERFPKKYQASYDDLGVCEWLLDKKTAAVEAWRGGLNTAYRDPAGGIYTRLSLWWAGAMSSDAALIREAVGHLERALTSPWATGWPVPIAEYVVGRISEKELLDAALEIDKRKARNLMTREALLIVGAKAFQEGDLDRARACFARCAEGLVKALGGHRNNKLLLAGYELAKLDAAADSPARPVRRPRKRKKRGGRTKGEPIVGRRKGRKRGRKRG